jgi:hypothetical protein
VRGDDEREAMRRVFVDAWRKARDGEPLAPLERLIAEIVADHPEYHYAVSGAQAELERDYPPETGEINPFLHMALHVGVREQLATDRPTGVAALYRRLRERRGDAHAADHAVIECLAESIWSAQRTGAAPDEAAYLKCLRARLRR